MRSPRLLVSQNSRSGCHSICATRSSVKCDSGVHLPVLRSMRPTSGGWTADCQLATTATGCWRSAVGGDCEAMLRPPYAPDSVVPTSFVSPPVAGTRYNFTYPWFSAVKRIDLPSGVNSRSLTDKSGPPAITFDVLAICPIVHITMRELWNVLLSVGCIVAYSDFPSGLNF